MAGSASLVVRGGTIFDGTGADPFEADVAIHGGIISAIGSDLPKGAEELDARGQIVTPGFLDVHTHYDAQATWSSTITPSSWNGVTTAMMGNCGVGFAPCLPHQRDALVKLMEGVEDIPEVVLNEGLPWNWETFEDYLDALDGRAYDLDIAAQVPHAALRVYVMGQRGVDREPATPGDRAAMARLAAAGVQAGALGFSTSRTLNHRTLAGQPIPTLTAGEAELTEIAQALGGVGAGWLQVISDFEDLDEEFQMLRRVVAHSGRPMAITVLQRDAKPDAWRRLLGHIADAAHAGLDMKGQVISRPTGILLGFELSLNPFCGRPSWDTIAGLRFDEKLAALRQPEFRARLLGEANPRRKLSQRVARWDRIFPMRDPPDYEPPLETSIAARAAREGRTPDEVAYDLLLENDGKTILYRPLSNYANGSLETVREMITHQNTLISLGDGGAHVGVLSDASATTYLLSHWTRDRRQGGLVPLAWAIKRLTRDNAHAIGLRDRGVLSPGYKADINVIDYDRLGLRTPECVYDLPAGGRRLIQKTTGYRATVLSGSVVYRDGEHTGALPGRFVRGAKPKPHAPGSPETRG